MSLPQANQRRLAIHVTKDAQRQLRGGSPWLFEDSITRIADAGVPPRTGDLGVVYDHNRKFLAIGLYDADSPIRLRVLATGKPTTIDAEFFQDRIASAMLRRRDLISDSGTTAFRCLHGENDGLGGLVADLYADTLVIKLYSASWLPYLDVVTDALLEATGATNALLRLARNTAKVAPEWDGRVLRGIHPAERTHFVENGLEMSADLAHGQKTGHFLDQRDNRAMFGSHAKGARVLDVFSCTGGFALNAAAGGATSVLCIDRSADAVESIEENFRLNRAHPGVASTKLSSKVGDAFEVLDQLGADGARFDLIVVDPPSFTPSNRSRPAAIAAYRRLTESALAILQPGGLLYSASCSARITKDEFVGVVTSTAAAANKRAEILKITGHAVDHPIGFEHGGYLKGILIRIA